MKLVEIAMNEVLSRFVRVGENGMIGAMVSMVVSTFGSREERLSWRDGSEE